MIHTPEKWDQNNNVSVLDKYKSSSSSTPYFWHGADYDKRNTFMKFFITLYLCAMLEITIIYYVPIKALHLAPSETE